MMRNAVATGKLLHSSLIEKESPPSGGMKKLGEKMIAIFYHVAIGGCGCVLGALTTNHYANNLHNHVETLVQMRKELDEIIVSTLPAKLQKIEIEKED